MEEKVSLFHQNIVRVIDLPIFLTSKDFLIKDFTVMTVKEQNRSVWFDHLVVYLQNKNLNKFQKKQVLDDLTQIQ